MTRNAFERDLRGLKDDVVGLGHRAGQAVQRAVMAVRQRNLDEAERVIADDSAIDAVHLSLEERCMRLLALQQPMARDLRTIASVFAITIDLERMADHAEGISRAVKRLAETTLPASLIPVLDRHLPQAADIVQEMLRDGLRAFETGDVDLARRVARRDDEVDGLRSQVFQEALAAMMEGRTAVPAALELLLSIQHLERAADHITNIAERVVYMVTGELPILNE
ncbi:MAG: phosphate signaling complex protein PhoU [Armatimonadota bacterium]|nr:phosphate signaling complex protein PhoU [Armatimonadota bacterium]